jgi:hypothetical protein
VRSLGLYFLFAVLCCILAAGAAPCQGQTEPQAPRRRVVVEMKGGTPINGDLIHIDTNRIQVEDQGRLVTIELDDVSRIVLDFMTVTPPGGAAPPSADLGPARASRRPVTRRGRSSRRSVAATTRGGRRGAATARGRRTTASRSSRRTTSSRGATRTTRRGREQPAASRTRTTARRRGRRG